MKKKIITIVYFVFLFALLVGSGYVFVFSFYDAIKNGENPFDISIPWIDRIMFFSFLAFLSALIVSLISIVSIIKEKRLKTAEERKQESKERRNEKILHLNAKIEKLKREDDE